MNLIEEIMILKDLYLDLLFVVFLNHWVVYIYIYIYIY